MIVNGDIVNRGPCPAVCWQFISQKQAEAGWLVTKGNHEAYVLRHHNGDQAAENGALFAINRSSYWTYQKLGKGVKDLAALPDSLSLTAPDGSQQRCCHASMRSNRDAIYPDLDIKIVRQQIGPSTAVFGTGHIHMPFVRQVDETLVVNSGSAGSQCYGDTRASYAQIEWQHGQWQARIIQLPYDRAQTRRDFHSSGFMTETGPVAQLIFQEWRTARLLVPPWIQQYQQYVLAGEIKLETAVAQFLEQAGLP